MIDAIFWSVEEIAAKASNLYTDGIQQQVETQGERTKMGYASITFGRLRQR
jgi:hypothetical protein